MNSQRRNGKNRWEGRHRDTAAGISVDAVVIGRGGREDGGDRRCWLLDALSRGGWYNERMRIERRQLSASIGGEGEPEGVARLETLDGGWEAEPMAWWSRVAWRFGVLDGGRWRWLASSSGRGSKDRRLTSSETCLDGRGCRKVTVIGGKANFFKWVEDGDGGDGVGEQDEEDEDDCHSGWRWRVGGARLWHRRSRKEKWEAWHGWSEAATSCGVGMEEAGGGRRCTMVRRMQRRRGKWWRSGGNGRRRSMRWSQETEEGEEGKKGELQGEEEEGTGKMLRT